MVFVDEASKEGKATFSKASKCYDRGGSLPGSYTMLCVIFQEEDGDQFTLNRGFKGTYSD